jgi:hypothetical protein
LSTNAGTAQSGALPPVSDEDIKPQETQQDQGSEESKPDSKTEKKQDQKSQPPKDGDKDSPKPDEAKEKGPGPWDAELQKRGLNDPRFDAFLREVVQPYVTQLEQGGGEIEQLFNGDVEMASAAAEMLQDFIADPVKAYRELGEVLGLEGGAEGEALGEEGDDDFGLEDAGDEAESEPDDPYRQYVAELMQREQEAREDEEFEQMLNAVGQKFGEGFDAALFTKFVIANGGDMDAALRDYSQYHRAPEPKQDAPPVVDGGGTPPPEAPKYDSIDSAIDAWLSEDKARGVRR